MILVIVAVNDEYTNISKSCINRFIDNNWIVKVLTNQPEKFHNLINVEIYEYNKKIFNFFDKILFPLQISEKYEEGVLYIDADLLCKISDDFILNFKPSNEFLYYDTWPDGETFEYYKTNGYFRALVEFLNTENTYDYNHLTAILEWIYYFPYSKKINNLIYDAERIKCVFEYMSILTYTGYKGIGNGEGIGISYILTNNNIKINKFEQMPFLI